ncbi:MAG: 1-acyl-sn-glycerol-3-phosphate acyltransferase, partial [Treponema sp.]|nr:1-acyl-sn-glycerol-3-phosphate acyltransferase [Treponema sp.]
MINTILAVLYFIFSLVFLLPFGLIAGFFYLFGLRKIMSLLIYLIAKGWAIVTIKVAGCTLTVKGRENIPKKGGVCFVSNHDGYFDIVLLLAFCGRPFGFIAKKELLFIPFLNVWIYLLGGLFIDRGNIRKAVRTINKGVQRIKSGGGMVIFPEGHRAKGRGLLPFHPGSLKLATAAEAPIVPVAIEGSYEVL